MQASKDAVKLGNRFFMKGALSAYVYASKEKDITLASSWLRPEYLQAGWQKPQETSCSLAIAAIVNDAGRYLA
jgi:hypothetical protein